ncbi:MAG: hypothetical protein FWE47_01910, partial [Oscillospiraceae bacterium]|nr:hypothetical protein [Oscillospiraceae bacterium]
RIVRIDGNIYYTGGDASNYTDKETVRFGDIVGRVIWHSSFLGSIITWASKPINMLCFIILPVGLITFFDVGKGYSLIKKFFSKERGRKFIKKKVPKTIIKKRRGRENKKRLILNT